MGRVVENDIFDPAGKDLAGMPSRDVFSLLDVPVFHTRTKVEFTPLQI